MREVSRAEFEEMYFRLGGDRDGWTRRHWYHTFAKEREPPMRYAAEEPPSPEHTRMMIVHDFGAREHRLFFMTEEAEERFFGR